MSTDSHRQLIGEAAFVVRDAITRLNVSGQRIPLRWPRLLDALNRELATSAESVDGHADTPDQSGLRLMKTTKQLAAEWGCTARTVRRKATAAGAVKLGGCWLFPDAKSAAVIAGKVCAECGVARHRHEFRRGTEVCRTCVTAEQAARQQANRERRRVHGWESSYRTRARRYGFEPVVESFTRADVIARYGDQCSYCDDGVFEELDHHTPIAAGGPHTLDNCRPSCAPCNRAKQYTSDRDHITKTEGTP